MYKKSLAILLSCLLLVTSFATLLTFSATAESNNLVADGKFENGFEGWIVHNNSGNSSAAFNVVEEEGGNHVLSAVSGLSMFKQVTLEAGVSYTVGFDFKFDTNAAVPATYDSFYRVGFVSSVGALSGSNFVGPYSGGNKYYPVYGNQKNPTEWKNHTFTYTPATDMTTYFVVGSFNHQGEANFFVDNVFICKTSDVVEIKTTAEEGGSVLGNFKTFKGDNVTLTAKPSIGYAVEGWYDANGTKVSSTVTYTFVADTAAEFTAKFKAESLNMITNGDFAVNNLDGFEVYKNGSNASLDFAFTPNGENDYILSGKAGHSLFKKVNLKAGVSYTMSFDFRFVTDNVPATYTSFYRAGFVSSVGALGGSAFVGPYPSSGNKYYSIYAIQSSAPTQWKNHTFAFVPENDMTVYAVIGSFNHECVADFEIDNWMLYKTSDMVVVNANAAVGGTVTPESAQAFIGSTVQFTATAEEGYEFSGWYDGDTLLSSDLVYNHTVAANITLTANFRSTAPVDNYIVNGDFEQPFTTDKVSDVSLTAVLGKWGKLYSGVARMEAVETANFTSADSAAKNGTRYILSGATKDTNQYIRGFGQYVDIPAGEYVLEFDAKSTADNMFVASIKKGQNPIDLSNDTIKYIGESTEWVHYSLSFTATEGGIYQIAFGGNTHGKGEGDFAIDNVKFAPYVEVDPNLVVNGDFEKPFTTDKISDVSLTATLGVWGKIFSGVARMEAVETADFLPADSAEKNGTRYILSGATKDSNQYIRAFGQYIELKAGKYILEFDAKATVSNMFVASVKKGQNPIDSSKDTIKYIGESTEWVHYSLMFTATEDGIYQIAFGGNTQGKGIGDFAIDNVFFGSAEDLLSVDVTTDGGGAVSGPNGPVKAESEVTVTATPEEGFVFKGWYNGDQIVSDTASYTFVVSESVTLKAVFEADLSGEVGIVKNGNFDIGTAGWKVVKTYVGSSAAVVVDPTTNSKVLQTSGKGGIAIIQQLSLKGNTEYVFSFDVKFDDFESVPQTYTSFYRSGFLKDPNGNLAGANFIGPETSGDRYFGFYYAIATDKKNDWNTVTYTYTPANDMDVWFVIGSFNDQGESNFALDNIVVAPKSEVNVFSAAAVSHGGSGTVKSSKEGVILSGETATLTATPNKGSVFGGWYLNGKLLSTDAVYEHLVNGSETVYARFLNEKTPDTNQMLDNSSFATGDLSGWGTNNISYGKDTVEYVTVDGESYVKLGESDMLYQTVELEPYSTYVISVTTRIPDIREKVHGVHSTEFYRFGIAAYGTPNVLQSGALEKDPFSYEPFVNGNAQVVNDRYYYDKIWGTYTYSYTNSTPDTILVHIVIGTPYCKADLHIKNFEFTKYSDGVSDFNPTVLYGEDFFNYAKNPSFENETTDADWGKTLPDGWTIKNQGKKNSNYLSVSGNQSKTYSFKVVAGASYVVAFDLRTLTSGTSSISIVDENGNPWGDALKMVDKKAILAPTADGKWHRMGVHLNLVATESGYAYVNIKITAGTNTLDIDNICITKVGYATHEENINAFVDLDYDFDNPPAWYNPTKFYALDDKTGSIMSETVTSPFTGDASDVAMVTLLLLLPCALVMLLTAKRTKKINKEVAENE